jgi:DNA-binding transcriptional regulator PaaX
MSLVMEILEGLWNTTLYYKGIRVNVFGFPMPWKPSRMHSENSAHSTISRMQKNGLIEIKNDKWSLTEKGRKYFEDKRKLSVKFHSSFILNAPKNLLLMFDIPESKKAEREWLRWHLREFQYYMIQKSVWVGPSPLPKKFGAHLKEIGLYNYIKTFKLAKPYKIKNGH